MSSNRSSDDLVAPPLQPEFLRSPGEMAVFIASFDWSSTSLGPIDGWPPCLRTITGFLIRSPAPIVLLWGPEGVMIYNDAYSEFAGGGKPGKLGSKVKDGWPEIADFNANVMAVGLAGQALSYRDQELTLIRGGRAEPVWMNLDYSPVLDDNGQPAGVIAIVIETTARVLADRRAAAEQERQRQVMRQMPGFVAILTGPDHIYEYVNDAYMKISERGDFIGRRFRDVFPDIAGQGFYELLDRVYEAGEGVVSRNMELQLQGSDQLQYIDFVFEPIRDGAGNVSGIFIGGYETTEAYRATLALQVSEQRLLELNADLERKIIARTQARGLSWQVSPDLMGALNAEGYFVTSNPAWKTILEWSEEEVANLLVFDLIHPDDVEQAHRRFELTQAGHPLSALLAAIAARVAPIAGSRGWECRRKVWSIVLAAMSPRKRRASVNSRRPRKRCAKLKKWRPWVSSQAV